jgi:hypothetical protein
MEVWQAPGSDPLKSTAAVRFPDIAPTVLPSAFPEYCNCGITLRCSSTLHLRYGPLPFLDITLVVLPFALATVLSASSKICVRGRGRASEYQR